MPDIKLAAEDAIILYFDDNVSEQLSEQIAFYSDVIKQQLPELIIEIIPSYCSLFLRYRISLIDYEDFQYLIRTLFDEFPFQQSEKQGEVIEIPAFYDEKVGLDLQQLLADKQLTLNQFTEIHSGQDYCVFAVGFSPAFAFLGQLDIRIAAPRLRTPRVKIPAGSIGIADRQTAVYPIQSSGGWNIIARTPLDLSLEKPDNLKRFNIGQRVRFKAINEQEFLKLGGQL